MAGSLFSQIHICILYLMSWSLDAGDINTKINREKLQKQEGELRCVSQ